MIDTHCHLDSERFEPDRDEVLARAWAAGVEAIVIPAVGPDTWEPLLALTPREPRLWVGLGIHPQMLPHLPQKDDEEHLQRLERLLDRGGAVAIGECGLDGPSEAGAPMERQVSVLRRHFQLAAKFDLPVLLHCFHAHPALTQLFRDEPLPAAGVILHSYSGGVDLAKFYAAKDCYFSFAGPVTYPGARKPLEALRRVPPERLLVETDAPDQAPHPFRGTRSEPAYVTRMVAAMAEVLGETAAALAGRTTANARRIFRRPPAG